MWTEFSSKRIALKVDVTGPANTVFRRVRASFSPEIVPAGALMRLTSTETIRIIRNGEKGVGGEADYSIATLSPPERFLH